MKSNVAAAYKNKVESVNHDFIEQEIKKEAFFLYLQGVNQGDSEKDWSEAEKRVKNHFRYLSGRSK